MNLDKVVKIIDDLAKTGDKKTLSMVCELLSEVSKYEKKESKKEKPVIMEESSVSSRASSVLDMLGQYDKPRTNTQRIINKPVMPQEYTEGFGSLFSSIQQPQNNHQPVPLYTPPNEFDIPYTPGLQVTETSQEVIDHLSMLL